MRAKVAKALRSYAKRETPEYGHYTTYDHEKRTGAIRVSPQCARGFYLHLKKGYKNHGK